MVMAILGLITAVLASIPYFSKWLTKTPTEKVEGDKQAIADEMQKFKDTGRPQ